MTSSQAEVSALQFKRERLSILLVDVVESVRLFEQQEDATIRSWKEIVDEVKKTVLPTHGGRLVRSVGDGMLISFSDTRAAGNAALDIQRIASQFNRGKDDSKKLDLRITGNAAELVVDPMDLFGNGVNVAARLMSVAGSGDIVVTESFRAELTDGLDADVTDLGECRLRHLEEPVRAYRIGSTNTLTVDPLTVRVDSDRPSIAVIRFRYLGNDAAYSMLGEAVADQVVSQLSVSDRLLVVSRLSSATPSLNALTPNRAGALLGARFLVGGSYQVSQGVVRFNVEVSESDTSSVVWAESVTDKLSDLFEVQDAISARIAGATSDAILNHELKKARTSPMQSLDNYALVLGAIDQMHRSSLNEFERARRMFEYLIEKEPRNPTPHAWLAKWYVLNVVQGWSVNKDRDVVQADTAAAEALSIDPKHALGLCIDGLIHAYMKKQMQLAGNRYRASLDSNPNESLAWLFLSTWHSYRGRGEDAVESAQLASRLSPIDPLKYFYQSLAATAVLSNNEYDHAIELCLASLKLNRVHASTYKTLLIAQSLAGKGAAATQTGQVLLDLDPKFGVQSFLDQYPGSDGTHAGRYADALRAAGIPE